MLEVDFTSESEYTKSDAELKKIGQEYLRDCEHKEYRRLARKGELDARLQEMADTARRRAEALIRQGTFPPQAWQWAIREKILDTPMD